jgi:DnaD/phage-associated family protein
MGLYFCSFRQHLPLNEGIEMKLEENHKLLLSDTNVPDIFIVEYLPVLDGLAVKAYIYLLLAVRRHRSVTEADLVRRMGSDAESVKIALLQLASHNLILIKEKGLEICDVKSQEIEKVFKPRTSTTPLEMMAQPNNFSRREKLMADLSKTFFQGLMSPSWYTEIDSWFDRYKFEPEVIYALFQECSRRNKLDSKAYISRVAENWAGLNIVTYQDLNAHFLSYEKISRISKKIGRKLRKNMTEYDEEIVTRWVEKMGYDFDIIEIALRKTVKLAQPNLAYIDKILQEWVSHQLKDPAAIEAYEKEKAARAGANRNSSANLRSGGNQKPANVGNFDQREYSENFLEEFYEPMDDKSNNRAEQD